MSRTETPLSPNPVTLNKSAEVITPPSQNGATTIWAGINAVALVDKVTQKQQKKSYVMKWVELEYPPEITHGYDPSLRNPPEIDYLFSLDETVFSFDGLKKQIDKCEQIDFDSAIPAENRARVLNRYLIYIYYLVTKHINQFSIQEGIQYRLRYLKRLEEYFALISRNYEHKIRAHTRVQGENDFIPVAESAAAELYRLVISPEFTPKVRAITATNHQNNTVIVGSISKTISNFQHFQKTEKVMQLLDVSANEKPQHWVRMIVACYIFAEFDLNPKNVGFDKNDLVKIDHDYTFFPLLRRVIFSTELPNTIYPRDALEHLTTFDIAHFPFLHDVKPATSINVLKYYMPKVDVCLGIIAKKDDTKDYAYYLMTKSLLLLTESTIATIINDFSIRQHGGLDVALKQFISDRMKKLKTALFMTPEYRDFLLMRMNLWYEKLEAEINHYNEITCGDAIIKTHKQHRRIAFSSVLESLKSLQMECETQQREIQKNLHAELIFRFKELMKRYSRETKAIDDLWKLHSEEENPGEKARLHIIYNEFLTSLDDTMYRDTDFLLTTYGDNVLDRILENINYKSLSYVDSKTIIHVFIFYYKEAGLSALLSFSPLKENPFLLHELMQYCIDSGLKITLYTKLTSNVALYPYLHIFLAQLREKGRYSDVPSVIHFMFHHYQYFNIHRTLVYRILNSEEESLKSELQSFSEKNPNAFLSALFRAIQGLHVDINSPNSSALFSPNNPHPSNYKDILARCATMLGGKKSIFSLSEFNYLKALHEGRLVVPDALRNALRFLFPSEMPRLSNNTCLVEMAIHIESAEDGMCKINVNYEEAKIVTPSLDCAN